MRNDIFYMRQALKMSLQAYDIDEVPVGAVIVHRNQVIAKAHNQVEMLKDPTAHAEMIALTQAANTINCKWLQESTLYVTIEPCCMCAGALVLARIKRLVFGSCDSKSGACGSVLNIAQHKSLNHRIEIENGVLERECASLIQDFFRKKRKKILEMTN